MAADIKQELAAAYAEAQSCVLAAAKDLRKKGKALESEALHGAFSVLVGADLTKMMFAHDDPLDQLYVEEGLGSLQILPEQVRLENWENVVAVANGFAALALAPPVRIHLPLQEEEAPEPTSETETTDLGTPKTTAVPTGRARRVSQPGAGPSHGYDP